jgi:hypothetical protein
MAEAVAMAEAGEASTVAVVLAAADFMAAGFLAVVSTAARMAAITVADTAVRAALPAVIAEDLAMRAAGAPTEAYTALPAPIMPGHPKVEAFATQPPAGMGLKPAAGVVGCPLVRDASEELPTSTQPLPMAGSTPLAASLPADSPATPSIMPAL